MIEVQAHDQLEVLKIVLLVHMAATGNHHVEKAAFHLHQNNLITLKEKIIRK